MAKTFRVTSDGVRFRVERLVERRFLWRKWTTWKPTFLNLGGFVGRVPCVYSVREDAFAVCRKLQGQLDALHGWSEVNE